MSYADFAFYQKRYLGTAIAEDDFERLALRASERIDMLTFGRAAIYYATETDVTPVKKAVCAVAEVLQQLALDGALIGGAPRSASIMTEIVNGHHITYAVPPNMATPEGQLVIQKAIRQAAMPHLLLTGLMYAGVRPCRKP